MLDILETCRVDNSSVSTATISANDFACPDTFDKVFTPSHKELKDGNITIEARATDYAIAQGTYYSYPSYDAEYWTRSPDGTYTDGAFMMSEYGYITTTNVDYYCGIRPMISIAGNPLY